MKKHPAPKPKSSLRPIPARMLKSIGDTLRPYLADSEVLELFAGEGRFSWMALDEGAARADLVESSTTQARVLQQSASRYSSKAFIFAETTESFLKRNTRKYAVIFADPPFEGLTEEAVRALAQSVLPHLEEEGIFLVKHPTRMITSARFREHGFPGYSHWKESSVGDASVTYSRLSPKQEASKA